MKKLILLFILPFVFVSVIKGQSVEGYIPEYEPQSIVDEIDYSKLTDVLYSVSYLYTIPQAPPKIYDANGNLQVFNKTLFEAVKKNCSKINLYLSIGDDGRTLSLIAANSTQRQNFASKCAEFCYANGLKGVDIDWEIPQISDSDNFKQLLFDLRTALDSKGMAVNKRYKLSIAAVRYTGSDGISAASLKYLDYLNIMDYDGVNNSPTSLAKDLMTGWANIGVPYSKMVIGIPFYGRNAANKTMTYREINPDTGSETLFKNDLYNGYYYNGYNTINEKITYAMGKGVHGVFSWELAQDKSTSNQYSLLGALNKVISQFATCTDKNEPNDNTNDATSAFTTPLNLSAKSVTFNGFIPDPSDQDWFKIPVDGTGTLTITLSNLPADYDLELYPSNGLAGGALKGSYKVSATSENITYNYSKPASTILYAKVYPKNSSQSSACGKYTLTINWAPPSQAACTTPQAPVANYGADVCSAPVMVTDPQNITLAFTSNGGNTFGAQISKYPYGTSNITFTSSCQSTTAPISATDLVKGMLYRWNMYAYGGTDCTSCQSPVSNTKYFGIPPEITAATTQLPSGGNVTLTTLPQVPGSGATINYKWLKNGSVYQQGASMTSLSVTSTGTYTLTIEYFGGGNCAVISSTAASNAIVVTAAIACTNSVKPDNLTQSVANTPNGSQVLLTVNGGSLGTNGVWKLYSGNCGGTFEGQGHANTFIVNPSVTTTYYIRAEGDCNITDCVSTLVVVPCTNSVMPSAVTVSTGNTPNGPTSILTVVGGSLGTNATWRVYSGSCGGVLEGSGHASTFLFNPTATTTYYIRAEGDCNFTDCATATIYVKPTISSFSPTTSPTGQSVTVTGTNFTGASAVSFGGVPSTLFTVNSPTSLTAMVGSGANGNVSVTTPGGTAILSGFNYIFSLPVTNFNLSAVSASCKGSNNGTIKVTAAQHLNYTATIIGNGLNAPYPFTDSVNINNLAAGNYNVCITVAGQNDYQQCYSMIINEPKDLSVYVASTNPGNQVVLNLGGGTTYNISLNGTVTTTTNSQVTLNLTSGINRIIISTDKACQGLIEKDITTADEKVAYPNPFDKILNISLGKELVQKADVKVFKIEGLQVFSQTFTRVAGSIQIDLSNLQSGQYLLKLSADNKDTVFKIIKR
ncbi:glycosyl hydrolase family 18 protein [Mucilaginibacter angelicae]|uniref:chitinase n=1 Tax=Mucilaginibacter angelicae TaxID=869718 RepID=A0ABV6L0Y9_9SPHI